MPGRCPALMDERERKAMMENPFETLSSKLNNLETMVLRLTNLMEEARPIQVSDSIQHDRRKPATREIAAEYLGVSVGTVDNLVRSKQLKACRVGKAVRFRWESLDEFINKRNK